VKFVVDVCTVHEDRERRGEHESAKAIEPIPFVPESLHGFPRARVAIKPLDLGLIDVVAE
jgi:hypothetical protein